MSHMSSDNDGPDRRKPYHHGALHSALVEASIALAREGGPDRVILREAARAAGVSHSAAYRHFADRDALLAEVSRFARHELAAEMRRRVNRTKDPRQRLQAVGMAYVDFAEPARTVPHRVHVAPGHFGRRRSRSTGRAGEQITHRKRGPVRDPWSRT